MDDIYSARLLILFHPVMFEAMLIINTNGYKTDAI